MDGQEQGVRIALCQITSTADKAANLALVAEQIATAAEQGARVVVFPESTMVSVGNPLGEVAEPLDGPWARTVGELARQHDVLVVVGMYTPAGDGRVRNTQLVTGLGMHVGYDKIHLFDAFGFTESSTVAPGTEPLTVTVDGVTFGIATCYDVRFPELFRALADKGATVILLGASWGAGEGKREQWELLVRARALDSTCWLLACGQADPLESGITPPVGAPAGIGYSLVADPTGHVRASLGAAPELLVVDVDPDEVVGVRARIPVLANRRL